MFLGLGGLNSFTVAQSESFSESRVVVGGLNAPNLLQQLYLLAITLVCNEGTSRRSSGRTRTRASSGARSRSDGWNRAVQRFRQHVVETDGKPKQDEEERNDVAPKQRLVQIKVVDDQNGGELQSDERERVLCGCDQFVLVANIDSHGHENPVQPRKRDGHFISGKHAHVGVFQGNKLSPHGRRLGANE